MRQRLDEATVVARAAKEFQDGWCVNLGVGMSSMTMNYVLPGVDIHWETENGILGYGTALSEEEWERFDFGLIDTSGNFVTEKPGMVVLDLAGSFDLIRGGHLDVTVVGALQVSEKGDLANWTIEHVPWRVGIGGAFDVTVGAKRCFVTMLHTTKDGTPRILNECSFPLSATQCVDWIFTDLAVIQVIGPKGRKEGLLLKEIAPGWTAEEVQALTEPRLVIASDLKEIQL